MIDGRGISHEIALRWISNWWSLNIGSGNGHQATSHYLNDCWSRSMSSCVVTRPQWVCRILMPYWVIDLGQHECLNELIWGQFYSKILNISNDKLDMFENHKLPLHLPEANELIILIFRMLWMVVSRKASCHFSVNSCRRCCWLCP